MFEGTGKYFLLLFLVYLIVYITKKICLYFLFKRMKTKPYKALIPIYTTKELIYILNMKKSLFWLCLIPVVNLFYYHKIYKQLLSAFGHNPEEAIWYVLIPMYKFPELVFKKPRFILNEYDLTNAFMEGQNALFEKSQDELPDKIELVNLADKINEFHDKQANPSNTVVEPVKYEQIPNNENTWNNNSSLNNVNNEYNSLNNDTLKSTSGIIIEPVKYEQIPSNDNTWQINNNENNVNSNLNSNASNFSLNEVSQGVNDNQNVGDSVFTNKSLEPDERHEKVVIVQKQEEKEKNPINPFKEGRPQMCPNCGAKLAPGATTCFLCGTKLK